MRCGATSAIVGGILSLNSAIVDSNIPSDPILDQLLDGIKFPIFDKQDISKIVAKINDGLQAYYALDAIHYKFPRNKDLIEKILSINFKKANYPNIITGMILNIFLSWIAAYERHGNCENLGNMLNLLEKTFNSEYSNLGSLCFSLCIRIILDERQITLIYENSASLFTFINIFPQNALIINIIHAMVKENTDFKKAFFDNFLFTIIDVHKRKQHLFNSDELSILMEIFTVFTKCFSYSVFSFLDFYQNHIESQLMRKFLDTIGANIFNILQKTEPFKIPELKFEPTKFQFKPFSTISYKFQGNQTFADGFSLEQSIVIENCVDTINLFSMEIQTLILSIKRFVRKSDILMRPTTLSFIPYLSPTFKFGHFYNLLAVLLMICSEYNNLPTATDVYLALISSNLFNNNISIFNCEGDFRLTNLLRNVALECIIGSGEKFLYSLLITLANSPLILAETFYRLSNKIQLVIKMIGEESELPKLFSQIGGFYQSLDCTENKQYIPVIEIARKAFFIFFKHLMSDARILELFFQDKTFIQSLFAYLFEESLQSYVLDILSSYLQIAKSAEFISPLQSIAALAISQLPEQKHSDMLMKIMKVLNDNLAVRRNICIVFSPFCQSITQVMMRSDVAIDLFEICAAFLAIMYPFYQFNFSLNVKTNSIVEKSDEYLSVLFTRMIQLLAGDIVSAIYPTFIVKQPVALKLMIFVFYKTPKIKEVSSFILDLCKFSPVNIQLFASVDVTGFLVDLLEQEKKNPVLDEETIGIFLNIYGMISILYSNAVSAMKFISLLTPTEGNKDLKHQVKYYDTLNYIATCSLNEPKSSLMLNGTTLEFPMKSDFITKTGFSITCWIYVVQNDNAYKVNLWNIIDSYDEIGLFIQGTSVYFHQSNGFFDTQGKVAMDLKTNMWHFLSITYANDDQGTIIYLAVDQTDFDSLRVTTLDFSTNWANPKLHLGGQPTISVQCPHRIAGCGLFKSLSPAERSNIFDLGVNTLTCPYNPIIYVADFNDQHKKIGFVDIIVERCGVASLLPLFSSNAYKYSVDMNFTWLFDSALTLLTNIIQYSTESQISFYHAHGFHILYHLLSQNWLNKFSLKTYNQLVLKLSFLRVDMLQQQLFDCILANVRFLMRLPPDLHLKILQVWSGNLFPNNPIISRNLLPLSDLLDILRIYYYIDDDTNEPKDKKITRDPKFQIKKCRSNIIQIICHYMTDYLYDTDFYAITNFVASCKVKSQVYEITNLLLQLITESPSSIKFSLETQAFIYFIHNMLFFNKKNLIYIAMSIIVAAKNAKLISKSFFYKVQLAIMLNYPQFLSMKKFYTIIMEITNLDPGFLPLCIFAAHDLKDFTILQKLTNLIQIDDNFITFWPFLVLSKENSAKIAEISDLYIRQNRKRFRKSIMMMNSALSPFQDFLDEVKRTIYLCYQSNYDMTNEEAEEYIITACQDIFYSTNNPFEKQEHKNFSFDAFLSPRKKQEKRFGIKFGEDGKWKHMDLAINCLSVFEKYNCRRVLPLDLLLCAFVLRTDPHMIKVHLQGLEITDKEYAKYHDFIDLISYHALVMNTSLGPMFTPCRVTQESYQRIIDQVCQFFVIEIEEDDEYDFYEMMSSTMKLIIDVDRSIYKHDITILSRYDSIDETGSKMWVKLWNELSVERGPWAPSAASLGEFETDPTICYGFFPAKTRRKQITNNLDETNETDKLPILIELECNLLSNSKPVRLKVSTKYIIIGDTIIPISEISHIISTNNFISKLYILTYDGELHAVFIYDSLSNLIQRIMKIDNKFIKSITFTSPDKMPLIIKWGNGEISTFTLVSYLNFCVGRSIIDPESQPLFPQLPLFTESGPVDPYIKGDIAEISKNRRLLEINSDTVIKWAISTFNIDLPQRFFDPPQIENRKIDLQVSKMISVTITNLSSANPIVHVLSKDGNIAHIPAFGHIPDNSTYTKTRLSSVKNAFAIGKKFYIMQSSGDVIVTNAVSGNTVTIETGFPSITNYSADQHLLAVCGNDNVVDVFGVNGNQLSHINMFGDSPTCIFVSAVFHAVVCGTDEGIILVYSANDGKLSHYIQLDFPAIDVCVSPSLGVIIAQLNDTSTEKHKLIFMTIDCKIYGSLNLNKFTKMICYTTSKGDDCIAVFHADYGWLTIINVASLKIRTITTDIISNVLCMSYNKLLNILLVITEDGFLRSFKV